MRIGADKIPNDLINMTLDKWKNNTGNQNLHSTDYILKVIGMEDYLYGEYPLRNFKVRSMTFILTVLISYNEYLRAYKLNMTYYY